MSFLQTYFSAMAFGVLVRMLAFPDSVFFFNKNYTQLFRKSEKVNLISFNWMYEKKSSISNLMSMSFLQTYFAAMAFGVFVRELSLPDNFFGMNYTQMVRSPKVSVQYLAIACVKRNPLFT